jgi:hypothetical protein
MALDELSATAYFVHDYNTGFAACEILLKENRLPQSEIDRVQKNHASYTEQLNNIRQMQAQSGASNMIRPSALAGTSSINSVKVKTFKKRKR